MSLNDVRLGAGTTTICVCLLVPFVQIGFISLILARMGPIPSVIGECGTLYLVGYFFTYRMVATLPQVMKYH